MSATLYIRCNSGHYFAGGAHCPDDDWSSAESEELAAAAALLAERGESPSIERLRQAGVSSAAIRRAVVMEFGDDDARFDLLSPEYYILDGKWVPIAKVGPKLL